MLLMLVLGIPLTVLLALEWSVYLPSRKIALWLVIAGVAWWYATAMLVQGEFGWRVWFPVNTVALVVVTFAVGFWLAGEIEKVGHLLPVCILGTIVDIWSVFHGPSKNVGEQIMQHQEKMAQVGAQTPPPIVDFLILHWPYPGADMMATLFGLGDLVFVAMFLAASRRFGLSLLKAVLLTLGGLILATSAAFYTQKPIPALPFICALFLAGNVRSLSLTRREWAVTVSVVVLVLLVGLGNYLGKTLLYGK